VDGQSKDCLFGAGKCPQAETCLGLRVSARLLGPGHPDTLVSLMNLALAYYAEGTFAKAEPRQSSAAAGMLTSRKAKTRAKRLAICDAWLCHANFLIFIALFFIESAL
jgi:hypothetical protein